MDPERRDLLMYLDVVEVPATLVRGIYTVKGYGPHQLRPDMRYLHPDAAAAFEKIAPWFVCSDMFRSPESSLEAVESGRGALAPGYSRHNFGRAVDGDVPESCKRLGVHLGLGRDATKAEMDREMEAAGFFCHRRDHTNGPESYHFNFLGVGTVIAPKFKTTYGYGEADLVKLYDLSPDVDACQAMLREMHRRDAHRYPDPGPVDNDAGKRTLTAAKAFQLEWHLSATGRLDGHTKRTLALVSALGPHRATAKV